MEKQWPLISDGPFKVDDFAPAVEIYIEPESDGDPARLAVALSALAADRPNFQFAFDQTVGATILSGIDELQLRELIDALKELHRVKIVGNPQAAYRERITEQTEVDYTHKKQTAGVGADTLATITDERGTFSVQFDRYASILPPDDPSFGPAVALSA